MANTGQNLYKKAKSIIPGGTQLLSKRPEMFLPNSWPSYYSHAKGSHVWDLDGNEYIDMSYNGIGCCVLGHADDEVNNAVHKAVDKGTMSTLNCPEEVELAELLCTIHPWANRVRYARSGGEAMSVAIRIARAATGKDKIAFCGYHGWHDWYLSANLSDDQALDGHLLQGLEPKGVPRNLINTAYPFNYNNFEELQTIVSENDGEIAAIVMEPMRGELPTDNFLNKVRNLANKIGAVLIFDEITIGFRINAGGAHLTLGTTPDVAVYGKAIGNGYPMSAVIGKEEIMEYAQESFISSTNWTEKIGPVAAITTIEKFRRENVHNALDKTGMEVRNILQKSSNETGLSINISGINPLLHFDFDYPEKQAIKTLFTKLMLGKGFLATNAFYCTYAHNKIDLYKYSEAIVSTFGELKISIDEKTIKSNLKGEVAHVGFQRLT